MKKKVYSFLLIITMISALIIKPSGAEEGTDNGSFYEPSADELLLMDLGIIDRENYNGNDIMTRGGFAVLLAKALGLDTDRSNNTQDGIPDVDDSEIIRPARAVFRDVSVSSDEYGAIAALYEKGYMVGVSDGLFAPEYGIVFFDAAKVFIDMLGYYEIAKAQGGYREGYEKTAYSMKLLSGVSCGFSDVASKKDIAVLLCNVMQTHVAKIENEKAGYSISDGGTFMEKVMNVNKITGVITDNGLTALGGASHIAAGQILCADTVINISAKDTYVRKYLGRKVCIYYSVNEDDEYDLIFAEPRDEVIVIPKKNYVDFNNGILEYYSEKNVLKTANIGIYESVIYNEVFTSSYTDDMFDIADGRITLIPHGNKYTVIIEDYMNFAVSQILAESSSVYNKISFDNARHGINSVALDDYQEVCILNEDGNPVPFSSIKKGDVLSVLLSPDKSYAEVLLSTDKRYDVEFTSVGEEQYATDTEVYDYLDVLKTASNAKAVRLGRTYTLYFNIFGNLVWTEESTESDDGFSEGILLRIFPNDEKDDSFGIKVYERSGITKSYYVDGKVRLNSYTKKENAAYSALQDYLRKPILYRAEDQTLKTIVTPLSYREKDDQRGWYQITADDIELKHIKDDGASFGGIISYNNESNVYYVPADNDKITVNETNFINHKDYKIEGYARSRDSIFADVLVCREDSYKLPESKNAFLITDVYEALDDKDEIRTYFDGYEFNITGILTKRSYAVDEETIKAYNDLGAGDIIRFSKNTGGEIRHIEVSYDYRRNSDGTIKNLGCENQAYTYMGYMLSNSSEGFRIVTPGKVTNGSASEQQFYTPDELMSRINNPSASDQNIREYSSMIRTYISGDGYPVVIVDTSKNKLTFEEATMDDVFAYENTASKFDTVVVMTHFFVGRMGMVVYR